MEKGSSFHLYKDIAERTDGDVYIGVVGPVRTGKSTFIARFMEELDRALDVTAGSLDATAGEDELAPLALSLALRSYADKLACQRLLELIRSRRPQPEKGKKAKSSREHPAE